MALILLIFTPLLVSALLLSAGRTMKDRTVEILSVIGGGIELVAALTISFMSSGNVSGFGETLLYDPLGSWFLAITAVVGFLGIIYSVSYLRRERLHQPMEAQKLLWYHALIHLFLLAMYIASGANNILLLWIAVEATTLWSAFLVNFFDRPAAIEAAWKYMIINTTALLLGLFGIFLFMGSTQHAGTATIALDWKSVMGIAEMLDVTLLKLAFVFMVIGYGTKAGLAPLHSWLPDAHSQAPSPVSAMLSGALLNIALLALLRFKFVVDAAAGAEFSRTILIAFGTTSIVFAAFLMLIQKEYKRLLAYSSVEHIGVMVFGFGVGGVAGVAALLHALYHSFAKTLLFFSSGNIMLRYQSQELKSVHGLLRVLPVTGPIFVIGALAVAGLPPFGIFFTEYAIFTTAFSAHPVFTMAAVFALALAFAGIVRMLSIICFGKGTGEPEKESQGSVIPLTVLTLLLIVFSVWPPPFILELLEQIKYL